jgi:hypothetical protein
MSALINYKKNILKYQTSGKLISLSGGNRNIHTNRKVITPREDYENRQSEKRKQSELFEFIQRNNEIQKAKSDIYIDPQTGKQVIQNIGIQPSASPIDAAVLGVGALYSGGINLLGSMANAINPLPMPNISKNGLFGDILWDGLLPRIGRGDLPKGGYFRKIGNEEGLKDLMESGVTRQPLKTIDGGFSGTQGTYFSKRNPIEDYEGRFLVHHPGEGEYSTIFDGVQDKKFFQPNDKMYPYSVTPVKLDDPLTTIYKRRFMTTKYDKIEKDKLEEALKGVNKYDNLEQGLRFGVRWGGREEVGRNTYNQWQNFKNSFDQKQDDKPSYASGGIITYKTTKQSIIMNDLITYKKGGIHIKPENKGKFT